MLPAEKVVFHGGTPETMNDMSFSTAATAQIRLSWKNKPVFPGIF